MKRIADSSSLDRRSLPLLLPIFLDAFPAPSFAIDADARVIYWNLAARKVLGLDDPDALPEKAYVPFYPSERPTMADMVLLRASDEAISAHYEGRWRRDRATGSLGSEGFFPHLGASGLWLSFLAHPLEDEDGQIIAVIETLIDITEAKANAQVDHDMMQSLEHVVDSLETTLSKKNRELVAANSELLAKNREPTSVNETLGLAQRQLIQSEKLVSIGQLAAGVAHEINNPVGFISSNLTCVAGFVEPLRRIVELCRTLVAEPAAPALIPELAKALDALDPEWFLAEIQPLVDESAEGLARVKRIVSDLKDFSRTDPGETHALGDLVQGLRQTAAIAHNEIKYNAVLVDRLALLPEISCNLSQLNQVFLNVLVNAAHACSQRKAETGKMGTIALSDGLSDDGRSLWIEIADDAGGIPEPLLSKIFDPFFTTKPIGQGTGLGLSISFGIVGSHGGSIRAFNRDGGAVFRIELPIAHAQAPQEAP